MLSFMRKIQPNQAIPAAVGQFRTHKLATLPRAKFTVPERLAHGLFFFVGMLAVPTYIMCNLKHYRVGR